MIQQEAISSNFTNSSNRTSSEYGNVDGPAKVIIVAQTRVVDFQRIQDVVNSVPDGNPQRVIIYIQSGVYKEEA